MTCDRCGHMLRVGDFPFCKNGSGHGPWNVSVIDDQLEGGPRRFDTMGHDMPFIESKSQWKREVERRGLVPFSPRDAAYHAKQRKMHDEKLRDTGSAY